MVVSFKELSDVGEHPKITVRNRPSWKPPALDPQSDHQYGEQPERLITLVIEDEAGHENDEDFELPGDVRSIRNIEWNINICVDPIVHWVSIYNWSAWTVTAEIDDKLNWVLGLGGQLSKQQRRNAIFTIELEYADEDEESDAQGEELQELAKIIERSVHRFLHRFGPRCLRIVTANRDKMTELYDTAEWVLFDRNGKYVKKLLKDDYLRSDRCPDDLRLPPYRHLPLDPALSTERDYATRVHHRRATVETRACGVPACSSTENDDDSRETNGDEIDADGFYEGKFDEDGYDENDYDEDGYDIGGLNRNGFDEDAVDADDDYAEEADDVCVREIRLWQTWTHGVDRKDSDGEVLSRRVEVYRTETK